MVPNFFFQPSPFKRIDWKHEAANILDSRRITLDYILLTTARSSSVNFFMSCDLFERISVDRQKHNIYWVQRRETFSHLKVNLTDISNHQFSWTWDCCRHLGLSTIQKTTSDLRQLANGIYPNATDEHVSIGESTANETLYIFYSECHRYLQYWVSESSWSQELN